MDKIIKEDINLHGEATSLLETLEEGGVSLPHQYDVVVKMGQILINKSASSWSDLMYPIQMMKDKAHWVHTWCETLEKVVKLKEKSTDESTN